jgi:hypothetical protein
LISPNPSLQHAGATKVIAHTAYASPQPSQGVLDAYDAVESIER